MVSKSLSQEETMTKTAKAQPAAPQLNARELLNSSHPLHASFTAWVKRRNAAVGGGEELTVRKARKFLAKFPGFRQAKVAA